MNCKNKNHSCNSCGEEKCGSKHNCHSANVVEVRHGEWIEDYNYGWWHYNCSLCDYGYSHRHSVDKDKQYKYCPNCGAKMEGETK